MILVTLKFCSNEWSNTPNTYSSNDYRRPQNNMMTSTEKEVLINPNDVYEHSKYPPINIQHQHDDDNENRNSIHNVRRDVNIYRSTNEGIQDSNLLHNKQQREKATGKTIDNIKLFENKADNDGRKTHDTKIILNNSSYVYSNIQLDSNNAGFNNKGRRTSTAIVTKNKKDQNFIKKGEDGSSFQNSEDNTMLLHRNVLKTHYREKRFSRLDEKIASRKNRFLHLSDDIVGVNIVEEDLLPFYRPTKYFLSPQLSFEQETQSTEDESPSGKLSTSTITINDVEPKYFASIASRNRRTTEAASSSIILNKEDDGNIDENDLSTILTSHEESKTKRSKKTTPQTFQLMEVDDDDRSMGSETKIYNSIDDRRPVLNLRSIDDQDDSNKKSNMGTDLSVTKKISGNIESFFDDSEEISITTTEDSSEQINRKVNTTLYDITQNNATNINGTFYDLSLDEKTRLFNSDEEDESVTPNPLDYLDITDDDLSIKGSLEDEVKQRKLVMISKILKDVEQQALQGANCTPGTSLNMGDIDLVGNNYKRFRGAAEVAVNRANWLTRMWKYASDVMQSSEYLLHSSLFSMIESNEMIFGAGNCYDGLQYKNYSLFCPFAYKSPVVQGNILAKDLAVEYKYLKPSSTWFWTPKQKGGEMAENLIRFETGKVDFIIELKVTVVIRSNKTKNRNIIKNIVCYLK